MQQTQKLDRDSGSYRSTTAGAKTPKHEASEGRRRLSPAVRTGQILDAALFEFSRRGYEATRMDDIASGAGLSKGGLYAHFASKEDVFHALLARSVQSIALDEQALARCTSVRDLVEAIVDPLYEMLRDPAAQAALRLLVSESTRIPDAVARWRAQFSQECLEVIRHALKTGIAKGTIRSTELVRNPWLALAPALHPLAQSMILGDASRPGDLDEARNAHVRMLCELLQPANPPQQRRKPTSNGIDRG